jgi:hypothetical protein
VTAVARAPGRIRPGSGPGRVPWRRLARVTWRQHRGTIAWMLGYAALAAVFLAVSGAALHSALGRTPGLRQPAGYPRLVLTVTALLQLAPPLAGIFIGAPLVARESEHGTAVLAWTQGASRARWLAAQVIPLGAVLTAVALALGLEYRWWLGPFWARQVLAFRAVQPWSALAFNLNPLPFAGWTLLAFALGLAAGAAVRRIVPAMAVTLAGYGGLLYETSVSWRLAYLAPLHRADRQVQATSGGGYGFFWGNGRAPGNDLIREALGWPDGTSLSAADTNRSATWYQVHHIVLWATYQPASRYLTFQLIEAGWLTALAAALLGATVILIRRRAVR